MDLNTKATNEIKLLTQTGDIGQMKVQEMIKVNT